MTSTRHLRIFKRRHIGFGATLPQRNSGGNSIRRKSLKFASLVSRSVLNSYKQGFHSRTIKKAQPRPGNLGAV